MRQLEPAETPFRRAGEGALLMTEQLALDERLGERADVHRDERLVAARAQAVNAASDELLAGTALTLDHHCAGDGRHLLDLHEHFADRIRLTDETGVLHEALAVERPAHDRRELVGGNRFGIDVDETHHLEPLTQLLVLDLSQADDRHSLPDLLTHYLEIRRISYRACEHDHVRRHAPDLATHVIDRRNHRRLDARLLERSIEPHCALDVSECDQRFQLFSPAFSAVAAVSASKCRLTLPESTSTA